MTKPTKWLCICPAWSEYSLCPKWVAKDSMLLHADSEDCDQTGRMHMSFCWFCHAAVEMCFLNYSKIQMYVSSQFAVSSQCAHCKSSIAWKPSIPKSIPKFLSGKQLLKNVTLQILNFIPVSLIKVLPIWCNFKFLCFFVLFNALKTDIKLKLHHMRNFLLRNLPR